MGAALNSLRPGWRRIVVALAAVLTISGGAFIVASPAIASVGCYGDYCSGKDPMATGCANDAVSVDGVDLGYGYLSLRWSPTCKTNWARLYVYPTRTLGPGFVVAHQSTGYEQYGNIYAIVSGSPQSETVWSPMIYSPTLCVKAGANLGAGYSWDTDWTGCH